ncbi:MAG: RtcB family protein [Candidatus Omnitrophica bacterium]|nr:RtcB family protein [Candidatus Omnitrophota bacterium]
MEPQPIQVKKLDDYRWEIPKGARPGMRVPGLIFADEALMKNILSDKSLEQVANVATLPGIVKASMAMPDIHWGYGAPVGGVAATDPEAGGVISPGLIGYDINCGVRLLRTNLTEAEVRPVLRNLVNQLFRDIPCGVGAGGDIKFSKDQERRILTDGAQWIVKQGYGTASDVEHTEARGRLEGADPDKLSDRAYERGKGQVGTLGSGNHFLEVQVVDQIFDEKAAQVFGLREGSVTVMIHSGSRGLGYQVCDDYLEAAGRACAKYGISLVDRQLVCAPVNSPEGRDYLAAMRAAANYAWANRQLLMHRAREVFERIFSQGWTKLGMSLIYDVAHNIAKMESYEMDGKEKTLCVHRKGATRAFPPGHPELPEDYRPLGQPVIIPGDMGRNSYLLLGSAGAITGSFGSACHGAGRVMSRTAAVRSAKGRSIRQELEAKGIIAMARGRAGLDEEQPSAYKDVNDVVRVVHEAGLSKRVARMRPIGVIKG